MTPIIQEKEPGVYIRSNEPERDLDFLWHNPIKREHDIQRSRLGVFAFGFVSGAVATAFVCLAVFSTGVFMDFNMPGKAIVEEKPVVAPVTAVTATPKVIEAKPEKPKAESKVQQAAAKFFGSSPDTEETIVKPEPVTTPRHHEVVSGDNLGSIAEKFYGSSAPKYVEKIQRANNMSDAHTLSLGQKLVIPPKDY